MQLASVVLLLALGCSQAPGQAAVNCLPPESYSAPFSILDPNFCIVAVYEAAGVFGIPSWGVHGGPLTYESAGGQSVNLVRWFLPPDGGASGFLDEQPRTISGVYPPLQTLFTSNLAVDLPFFGWTAVSWADGLDESGALVLTTDNVVAQQYAIDGVVSVVGVGDSAAGRLLSAANSPLGAPASGTAGLYAATTCTSSGQGLGVDAGCPTPILIDGWSDYGRTVFLDSAGNAFAAMESRSASVETRGFSAAQVAPGAPPVTGTTLLVADNEDPVLMAAVAPEGTSAGVLVIQTTLATTGTASDVIERPYLVDGGVILTGTPGTLLRLTATQSEPLWLMTDPSNRLWVTVPNQASGPGTTFFVLARPYP